MGFFKKEQDNIAKRYDAIPSAPAVAKDSMGNAPFDFSALLDDLRRSYLEELSEGVSLTPTTLGMPHFVRIVSLPRLQTDQGKNIRTLFRETQMLGTLYARQCPVILRFEQHAGELYVLLGLISENAEQDVELIESAVACQFPGSETRLFQDERSSSGQGWASIIVGVPQVPPQVVDLEFPDFGSLASALRGADFGLTIVARPLPRQISIDLHAQAAAAIREWSPHVREGIDISNQAAQAITSSIRRERVHQEAKQAVEWMELLLDRFNKGLAEGLWEWWGVLWAEEDSTLATASHLIKGIISGPESLPEPIRLVPLTGPIQWDDAVRGRAIFQNQQRPIVTTLPTGLLASLFRFPDRSSPGFSTIASAAFSTAEVSPRPHNALKCGTILDRGANTGHELSIALDSLASHGLVVGMTGAGKTNSCMVLLKELSRHNVPFLVIEPAKNEYRSLHRVPEIGDRLLVFTLGDENSSPFRLNPFEFPEGFRVGTHLDFLKSVFVSSFSMYGPMPHILEEAVVRVYEKRGWDLASGINIFQGELDRAFLFPTLSDLLDEIDPVVEAIGYAEELTMDVRGALRTRIKSLLTGAKGMMLGSMRSTPLEQILEKPCVLELAALGDDQEKALLMGLLLVRIYEYRQVKGTVSGGLLHLTLIEEAHRILKNVSTNQTNPEVANIVGKAVDTFNNIMSEVRAFGEGILIAEQIPAKLSPDAIKNSGFKLCHRLHAPDDRQSVGGSMVLTEKQLRQLALLPDLSAVAFGAGLREAVLLSINPEKPEYRKDFRPVRDADIASYMSAFQRSNIDVMERFPSCFLCSNKCRRPPEAIKAYEDIDSDSQRAFRINMLEWVFNLETSNECSPSEDRAVQYCIMAHVVHNYFKDRAMFYHLTFADRFSFERDAMRSICSSNDNKSACIETLVNKWRDRMLIKSNEQTLVCQECSQTLCYGSEMDSLVSDINIKEMFNRALSDEDILNFFDTIVRKTMGHQGFHLYSFLSYCYYIRRYSELGIKGADAKFSQILEALE